MAGSITALSKLGIGSSTTVTDRLAFADFSPGVTVSLLDTNATLGQFSKDGNRVVTNQKEVFPRLSMEPTAIEWSKILEWIMGGTPTGSGTVTYPLGNATPERYVHWNPNAAESYLLTGVAVDTATIRGATGTAVSVDLELVGRQYDAAPASFPAIDLDKTSRPFILSHMVITAGGVTKKPRGFTMTVRNMIDRTRFLNSDELTVTQKLGRQITLSCEVPSGDNSGFWDDGLTGATWVATFTNPISSAAMVFSLTDIRYPARAAEHPRGGEGFLTIEGEAYMASGGTEALVTTLNLGS